MPAPLGLPKFAIRNADEAIDPVLRHDDDAPPVASIAPVGTSTRYVRFAAKAEAPSTSVAGLHFDFDTVYEHGIEKGTTQRDVPFV